MYKIYQVISNENLNDIAEKLNTTEQELRKINGFTKNMNVVPGQYIIVPVSENVLFNQYTIQKGDNIYSIAKKYDISVGDLLKLNGLSENEFIYPGESLLIPKDGINFYITEEGDTLENICQILNTNMSNIMNQNKNIRIIPEQLIVIKREEII